MALNFKLPEKENQKIWRYMDFPKFVWLLQNKKLYFCRADLLGDPFEGSYSELGKTCKDESLIQQVMPDHRTEKLINELKQKSIMVSKEVRQRTYINCWHMNDEESAAMWKLYASEHKGIAIQTTFKVLQDQLPLDSINIGCVEYRDYITERVPESSGDYLWPLMYKRKSFEHEKELRALLVKACPNYIDKEGDEILDINAFGQNNIEGEEISVKVEELIEKIYVSPLADKMYFNVVEKIIKETYKFNIEVKQSSLNNNNRPIF